MSERFIPLLLVSVLLLLIDWYIFRALSGLFKKPSHRKTFSIAWWGFSILLISAVFSSIFLNLVLSARAVILVLFVMTFVTKTCYLPFLFADDIRRFFIRLKRKPQAGRAIPGEGTKESPDKTADPLDHISRSEFILKAGIAVASIPLASLSWGIVSGAYDYQIKNRKLYLKNLPKAFDGIKMAQISDIHSGSFYNRKAVLGGVEMLLKEKPDFIFFTGDIINYKADEMMQYQDIFAKVKAPLGVFSTLGNHDYGDYFYGRQPSAAKTRHLNAVIQTHRNMGWKLLMNEHRRLKIDGEEIGILGVENWGKGERFPKKARLDLTLAQTDDLPVKLLLSHDPTHWREQVLGHTDIDATFSGHTHGMQFGVRTEEFQWSPVQYIYKEWAGLYQENNQQLYVNVGYGFLGYPGRVGILPEITIFELKRA